MITDNDVYRSVIRIEGIHDFHTAYCARLLGPLVTPQPSPLRSEWKAFATERPRQPRGGRWDLPSAARGRIQEIGVQALVGKTTGPYRAISQLRLYDYDEETRRMRLLALHPGVKVEEALAASDHELLAVGEAAETIPPTEEQERIMHELDPAGLILGR